MRILALTILAIAIVAVAGSVPAEVAKSYEIEVPLGLQREVMYLPAENEVTAMKVELGKQLFFDPRLSRDHLVSCASCHDPELAFTDGRQTSIGIDGQIGDRNAPTIVNRVFSLDQFWDGRAGSLEEQAKGPLINPIEMGFTHEGVVSRVREVEGYRHQFAAVFDTEEVTIDLVTQSLAAFERTLMSGDSPFDRFAGGDSTAMSDSAQRGLVLFRGRTECFRCHVGFNFTDENYRNIGVGMDGVDADVGRMAVTERPEHRGAFKTPTLRDVALTAPYFHDGSVGTLEAVVDYYDKGGIANPQLAPEIKRLDLTPQEKVDLVEFMKALTGEQPRLEVPVIPK